MVFIMFISVYIVYIVSFLELSFLMGKRLDVIYGALDPGDQNIKRRHLVSPKCCCYQYRTVMLMLY